MNFKKSLTKFHKKCLVCDSSNKLSIDHIRPVSMGGISDFFNYLVLCEKCNTTKGSTEPRYWLGWISSSLTDQNRKTLNELISFSELLHCCGDTMGAAISAIPDMKCYICNPYYNVKDANKIITISFIPDYFKAFLVINKELFKHSDCMKESSQKRILYGSNPQQQIPAIDASKTLKELVMMCHVPDAARTFIKPMTTVIRQDKFFVRGVNSCFCKVLDTESNKAYFIHEDMVHHIVTN